MAIFEKTLAVNYSGVVHTVKAAVPGMVARREGQVVLIASVMAIIGAPREVKSIAVGRDHDFCLDLDAFDSCVKYWPIVCCSRRILGVWVVCSDQVGCARFCRLLAERGVPNNADATLQLTRDKPVIECGASFRWQAAA